MNIFKNVYVQSVLIAIVLTSVSYLVAFAVGWVTAVGYLEMFAVFTSYACTYLCVKEKRFNYPIGAVSSAAYALLFFQQGLLASTILNGYLAIALIYGWFRWRADSNARPVTRVEHKWIPAYLGTTALFYLGALGLVTVFGGQLALFDTIILVGTILAQFLLDNKKIETWPVWVIVNVAAIYVYFSSGLFLAGFQYIFFLLNTLYGFYEWKKSMNRTAAVGQATPVSTGNEELDIWESYGFTNYGYEVKNV